MQDGKDVRLGDWSAREIEVLNSWQLLTAKPVVYLVNMSAKVGGWEPKLQPLALGVVAVVGGPYQ